MTTHHARRRDRLHAMVASVVDNKHCPTCGETKPLAAFSSNRSGSGGKNWQCKPCNNAAGVAYRAGLRSRTDQPGPCTKGHPRIRTKSGAARCRICTARHQANMRERRKSDPEYLNRRRKASRDWVRNTRDKALAVLGGACACCGQTRRVFLHIDHIDGGGRRHRRETGVRNSYRICSWITKNPGQAPALYQILCANCNMAKELEENHACP